MRQVIRIEHPYDGMGIWCSRPEIGYGDYTDRHSRCDSIITRHNNKDLFPTFSQDKQLSSIFTEDEVQDYHFAFKSLDQFEVALTREEVAEFIENLGFRVLMLDVTEYLESDYQVVFKKESIVKSVDISFMFLNK